MPQVSIGAAIGAGFRLIGREPLAFLAWCAVYLVIGVLPQLWVMSQVFPVFGEFAQRSRDMGSDPGAMQEMMRLQSRMMSVQPISWLSSLVSLALINGAVIRAIVHPDDRDFLYLRLSARELWLGLTVVVLFVLMFIAILVAFMPAGVILAILGVANAPGMGFLTFVVMTAAMGVLTWLGLRVSMAPIQSFEDRNFRLTESWGFTLGHAWPMFLVGLTLTVIVWLLEVLLAGGGFLIVASAMPIKDLPPSWVENPFIFFERLGPGLLAGLAVLWCVIAVFVTTLYVAAWSEMYRQLRPEPAA